MDFFEKEAWELGYKSVAGIDEAGRGPLAGPVVAAAVIFKPGNLPLDIGIKDSKKLSPQKREDLASYIYQEALSVGVGIVRHNEVDAINIHRASLKAMEKAVRALIPLPDFLLIDGPWSIEALSIPQKPIISGDSLSVTIAAASIIAKTERDKIMRGYHYIYPGYNFMKNKGYPTQEHILILERIGPSPIHRKSFRRVAR